jgi:hypothetical protein
VAAYSVDAPLYPLPNLDLMYAWSSFALVPEGTHRFSPSFSAYVEDVDVEDWREDSLCI